MPINKSQYPQFGLRLPPKLKAKLEKYAEEREMSLTEAILTLIRKAVGEFDD